MCCRLLSVSVFVNPIKWSFKECFEYFVLLTKVFFYNWIIQDYLAKNLVHIVGLT